MSALSAAEFEAQYLERCQAGSPTMTLDNLRSHRKVVPCGCDYEGCEGWGMVPLDSSTCGECGLYEWFHPCDECPGFTKERRWPRSPGPLSDTGEGE